MSNYFNKIKEILNKSKVEISNVKDKLDVDKLKQKAEPIVKNLKENNEKNKQMAQKMTEKFSYLYKDNFKDINKYMNSNSFWKAYYNAKARFKGAKPEQSSGIFSGAGRKFKDFFSIKKTFFYGSFKHRIKMLGLKLFLIYLCYLGIKVAFHRAISPKPQYSSNETMQQLQELKRQNEEIIKRNRELLEENKRYRGN